MKICITGHSKGIGKFFFDRLAEAHDVRGFSRSNGFDLTQDIETVVKHASECDILINNAPAGNAQILLLERLCGTVPKIITMGSVSSNYPTLLEKPIKNEIEDVCNKISMNPNLSKILLLKLGFLEATQRAKSFGSNITISFQEIYDFVEYWIYNEPKIYKVDYVTKMTPYTIERLRDYDAKNEDMFNNLVDEVFQYGKNI